jgi:taurine dioxygenase
MMRLHEETGYHTLYLGRRPYSYVNGLSLEASEALLNEVWAHATQPQFTWHHQWRLGDVLIWDNRCTMHRRDPFDPNSRRIMHRTQCKGTPIVATTAHELAQLKPHPRAAPA